jgi:NAD+ diphosphatase
MSHAESATPSYQTPSYQTPSTQLRANHLFDTVLPVRPALVDRGSAGRIRPGMVEELLGRDDTLAAVLCERQALVQGDSLLLAGASQLLAELQVLGSEPDLVIYLGAALPGSDLPAGTELVLFVLPAPVEPGTAGVPADASWTGFRDIASALNPTDTALFVEASAIANWHSGHTHCPRCGAPTVVEAGGWVRRCPQDGSEHYPRTDPAIIVTVVGPDGRLLLGGGGPVDARHDSTHAGVV